MVHIKQQDIITIYTQKRVAEIGNLFGIFFEDLNHAVDGGLYAELVQNRSFEFDPIDNRDYHALTAWEKVEIGGGAARLSVETEKPLNPRNPHYLCVEILSPGGGVGVRNLGFNAGICVPKGVRYRFSCYARRSGTCGEPVRIVLERKDGSVLAQTSVPVRSGDWQLYRAELTAAAADHAARLTVLTGGTGRLYLDMVSLFPTDTFHGHESGLRRDLAELIADLHPKFMRFPGGCLVHDGMLDPDDRGSMYRWKNTLGDVAQRPPRRSGWGCHQTLGLGFYEYFLFCEDIGAKPVPVLPAGYDPHHRRAVPLSELGPWIDDALDLIEFANGDASTPWGKRRAGLGHPEPFELEYIGIGNEEVGEDFFERYHLFHKAIKGKYPDIKIINTSGPFAAGGAFERGWRSAREEGSDVVDEHYYQAPEWFLAHIHRYDRYDPAGPKVFLGEYATWGNTFYNAVVEAAYMTALQNNARAVELASYAPLLCNADYVNWKPDLIWFDGHESYGTPNYYVQQLFMKHQGDALLRAEDAGFTRKHPADLPIRGGLSLSADGCTAVFSAVSLRNDKTGETCVFEGGTCGEGESLELGATEWESYTLRFRAKKLAGPKGFLATFGRQDDENRLYWEIGGWQNQDSCISSRIKGRGSCLSQSLFTVEEGVEYDAELAVSGRRITVRIDGRELNTAEDILPVPELLYYTASFEKGSGDVIFKAVNVTEEDVSAELRFSGFPQAPCDVRVYALSGYAPEEENSFTQPKHVTPTSGIFQVEGPRFSYRFPKLSVTVLRLNCKNRVSENGGAV